MFERRGTQVPLFLWAKIFKPAAGSAAEEPQESGSGIIFLSPENFLYLDTYIKKKQMKHVKLFEQFSRGEEKFIWLGFPTDDSGYSAGVVTKEEAEKLEMLDHGSIEPLGDNVYVYIDLGQVEMRPETADFNTEGLSYISANGEDNHDDEPDYDRLVIELPQEGIITTNPDGYSWNAQLLSVDDYIQNAEDSFEMED